MKRWVLILVLGSLFYLVSTRFSLSNIIFISSIHYQYNNENFMVSLMSLEDDDNIVLKCIGESLDECFTNLSNNISLDINYRHVQSMILDVSMFNEDCLDEFERFILNNTLIDFNFYLYSSDEKPSYIYNYNNPDNISNYYSILNPDRYNNLFYYSKKCHFVNYLKRRSDDVNIKIPFINVNNISNDSNLFISGFVLLNNDFNIIKKEEYNYLYLLNEFKESTIYLDNFDSIIKENNIKYEYKDKYIININVTYEGLLNLDNYNKMEEYLYEMLLTDINNILRLKIDLFNLEEINLKRNKKYTNGDVLIKLSIIKR